MNRFRPLAVVVQIVIGEYDAEGDLIAEHPRPPVRLLKPLGLHVEQQAAQSLREVKEERQC